MDCTPLVVGLHPCSLCGVHESWYAKPPGHTFGGSGGGSLQPQPSPSQCHASHLRRVLMDVPWDQGPSVFLLTVVQCPPTFFYPWHRFIWFPASVVARIIYHNLTEPSHAEIMKKYKFPVSPPPPPLPQQTQLHLVYTTLNTATPL